MLINLMASKYMNSVEFPSTIALSTTQLGGSSVFPTHHDSCDSNMKSNLGHAIDHINSSSALLRTNELSGSEQEGEQLVVVDAPNTMRSSRFQPIDGLKMATNFQICRENEENGCGKFLSLQHERFVKTTYAMSVVN